MSAHRHERFRAPTRKRPNAAVACSASSCARSSAEHLGDPGLAADAGGFPHGAALTVDGSAWVLIDGLADRSLGRRARVGRPARRDRVAPRGDRTTPACSPDVPNASHFRSPSGSRRAARCCPRSANRSSSPPAPSAEHLDVSELDRGGRARSATSSTASCSAKCADSRSVVSSTNRRSATSPNSATSVSTPAADSCRRATSGVQLEVGVGCERSRGVPSDPRRTARRSRRSPRSSMLSRRTARSRRAEHPLNRLGQERFLRWRLEQDPSIVGLDLGRPRRAAVASPQPQGSDPMRREPAALGWLEPPRSCARRRRSRPRRVRRRRADEVARSGDGRRSDPRPRRRSPTSCSACSPILSRSSPSADRTPTPGSTVSHECALSTLAG